MRTRWCALVAVASLNLAAVDAADHSVGPITSRIPREPLQSTALVTVGYSGRLRALEIEFHDGSIYRYLGVPRSLHQALLAAESKAGYYNRYVRGKYHCVRVKRPRPR